jgi:hypothetical protein
MKVKTMRMTRTLASLVLIIVTFAALKSYAKLDPSDFPLDAKIVDVKESESGVVSKTTKGTFCDNVPADSPLCANQKARTVTTPARGYILGVQIGDKTYEAASPYLLDLGDYKARIHGSYLKLLSTNAKGDLRAYNLKIVGVHLAAKDNEPR